MDPYQPLRILTTARVTVAAAATRIPGLIPNYRGFHTWAPVPRIRSACRCATLHQLNPTAAARGHEGLGQVLNPAALTLGPTLLRFFTPMKIMNPTPRLRFRNLGVFLAALLTSAASAATYYVDDAAGADTNSGTSTSAAWKTVTRVNAQSLLPGDTVKFKGGETFSGRITLTQSGASGNPITIDSYGTGRATISSVGDHGLQAVNQGYITVRNLIFTGDKTTFKSAVYMKADTADYYAIKLENITVSGYFYGINISNGDYFGNDIYGFHGVTIAGCDISDCLLSGIYTSGNTEVEYNHSDLLIENCVIENITGLTYAGNNGSGMRVHGFDGGTIQYCLVRDCGSLANNTSGVEGSLGINVSTSRNVVVQYCEVYNQSNGSETYDGEGIGLDGGTTNCIAQYNYVHGCDGAGLFIGEWGGLANTGAIFRYNIAVNNGKGTSNEGAGMYILDATNSSFYNNTIYQNTSGGQPAVRTKGSNSGSKFYNNIVYVADGTTLADLSNSVTLSDNLWYTTGSFKIKYNGTTYTSLSAYQSGSGQGSGDLAANPQLSAPGQEPIEIDLFSASRLSGYKLLTGSPALNTGKTISGNGGKDYWGTAIAGNQNIGAYEGNGESGGGGTPPSITNPGFESGTSPWTFYGSSRQANNAHTGTYSARSGTGDGGVSVTITGLSPNTTYTLKAWGKKDAAASFKLFVSNFGGSGEQNTQFTSTSYAQKSLTFTTGSSATSATIGVWKWGGSGYGWCDDFTLSQP